MKIYEDESGFYELNEGQDLGRDQKPYKIELSINKFKNKKCSEMFPQYELKIFSEAADQFQNQLKFVYKKRFHFSNVSNNNSLFLLRFLNDLKKSGDEYEKKILEYMKFSLTKEKFLKIKEQLEGLNSLENLQLENNMLLQEIKHIDSIKENVEIINDKVESIQKQVDKLVMNEKKKHPFWMFWKSTKK